MGYMTEDDEALARIAQALDLDEDTSGPDLAHAVEVELDRLRTRVAELESGEVRTEWGVGDPNDCADPDDVHEVDGPDGLTITDRDFGRSLLCRDVRVGPYRAAPVGGAS